MVSLVTTTLLLLIFWVSFASLTATVYYPQNNGKMASITIFGLSGSEALQFGFGIATLISVLIALAMFTRNKKFKGRSSE